MAIFTTFWKTSEMVKNRFKIFGKNRECSEIFGKLRKRFKSVFQMILWVFFSFWNIFGSVQTFSETFGKLRKLFKSVFQMI